MGFKVILGKYLAKKNTLVKADAIIVVSGGGRGRIDYALSLYQQGYAPWLILSGACTHGAVSDAMRMKQAAMKAGIPAHKIILEEKATNTYENALFIKKIANKRHFSNLILVTSPYHQRRVYETFKEVFTRYPVQLQNAPSTFSRWHYYNWWKFQKGITITISESIKLILIKVFGVYK